MAIGRAGIFTYGQAVFIAEPLDIGLMDKDHGTYYRKLRLIQICAWGEAVKLPFIDHGQKHSFNDVIFVMGISDFVAA